MPVLLEMCEAGGALVSAGWNRGGLDGNACFTTVSRGLFWNLMSREQDRELQVMCVDRCLRNDIRHNIVDSSVAIVPQMWYYMWHE